MWRIFHCKFLKEKFPNLKCSSFFKDGDFVKKGSNIIELSGDVRWILCWKEQFLISYNISPVFQHIQKNCKKIK